MKRKLYVLTTIKQWFLVPVGRPIRNSSVYVATDKKVFRNKVSYQIYGTWYGEECFTKEIYEIWEQEE